MTGPNASGSSHYLSLSGFELYGKVVGVVEEPIAAAVLQEEQSLLRQRAETKRLARHLGPGVRVVRGPDWKWNKQDGDPPGIACSLV